MTQETERPEPHAAAAQLWAQRYSSARVLFCAGSAVRGEGFPHSDLDIVVLFDRVDEAWRESFTFAGWPVEVFAHDRETLAYFVAQDIERGRPSLAQMISEALVLPSASVLSEGLQSWARKLIATGPTVPSAKVIADERYSVSDILDDFRDDRPKAELNAIACQLYSVVCNFVLKTRGHWLGAGKTVPRALARAAPDVSELLEHAFEVFFTTGDRTAVLRAVPQVLASFGGELRDGFRAQAPRSCRAASSELASLWDSLPSK
jgi:hypothetical protein